MSHRKPTTNDVRALEEADACANDVFVQEEFFVPPAVTNSSEREIEKYRRSTIKKSKSANSYEMQRNKDNQVLASENLQIEQKLHKVQKAISVSSQPSTESISVQGIHHDHENLSYMSWNSSIWLKEMLTAAIEDLIKIKDAFTRRLCDSFFDNSADETGWKNIPTECHDIGVLIAALEGNVTMLRCFLEIGGDSNATDLMGRTALHYAASCFRSDARQCIELLIKNGANVDVWDSTEIATPLICAAASGRIELIDVFINAGANVNAGQSDSANSDCSSPLVWAVRARSMVCAKRLIGAGSSVNSLQVYSKSPIHVAAIQGDPGCLKLLLDSKANTSLLLGTERRNALHLASAEGHVECIRILLQHSKAQVNTKDSFGRTPLHLAALAESLESVEELLKNGAEIENCDEMKMTPLHVAVMGRQSTEVVKLLISKGANVNAKDEYGQTPIHIAAYNENSKFVSLLIQLGADLSAKNFAKDSALASIVRRVPDALTAISRKLDSAIEIVDKKPAEPDCELRLNLRVLVPCGSQQTDGEMRFLASLVATDQQQFLNHPLIMAFLHLKWMKNRTTFIISLIFQTLYVLSLTSSIYYGYVVKENLILNSTEKMGMSNSETFTEWPGQLEIAVWGMTIFWGVVTGIKEMFQFYCNAHEYVRDTANYFQIISILAMFITMFPMPTKDNQENITKDWQHHIAALLIIVASFNLMLHVGRFPVFGIYVQMFNTVARNIGKLLVATMSLIIGFSIGFAVLFPKTDYFSQMPGALLTTIVMMAGEIDYRNLFFAKNNATNTSHVKYVETSYLIYLVFVLFIVIVLMNLIVGLAVSDIKGLQKSADLNRLVRLTKQAVRMESFIFFPWHFPGRWLKSLRLLELVRRNVLVVSPNTRRNYKFRPNDPRDRLFPSEIKKSLLKIVVKRVANNKNDLNKKVHLPIAQTVTGQTSLDSNNTKLFAQLINRIDNLSLQIDTLTSNMDKSNRDTSEEMKLAIDSISRLSSQINLNRSISIS